MTRSSIVILAALLAGCSSSNKSEKPKESVRVKTTVPEEYQVKFDTTKGEFVVAVYRAWAPRGADRFHELVEEKFFDGSRFFRVRPKFIVQFGIHKDPAQTVLWRELKLPDDPVTESNKRATVSFATNGPATRTTQVFINLKDNPQLDARGFSPFGKVVSGMDVVEKLYSGYGEVQALGGGGPDQTKIEGLGEPYLARNFERLDTINSATVVKGSIK